MRVSITDGITYRFYNIFCAFDIYILDIFYGYNDFDIHAGCMDSLRVCDDGRMIVIILYVWSIEYST